MMTPATWDPQLLERTAQGVTRDESRLWAHLLSIIHYGFAGDEAAACRHLETIRPLGEQKDMDIPTELRAQIAFYYALHGRDVEIATRLLSQAEEVKPAGVRLDQDADY